jgi:hypothetical protein
MDIKQIYSAWRNNIVPTSDNIVYFTLTEKTRELQMTSLLLRASEKTVNISVTPELAEKIPRVWDDNIKKVVKIKPINKQDEQYEELRIFLESKSYQITEENEDADIDDLVNQMGAVTITPADDTLVVGKSKSRIQTLASRTNAQVSMDWVRACTSRLEANEPSFEDQVLDRESFVLTQRDATDRHVHYVNPSVIAFLHELHKEHKDAKGRQLTVTWQFSYDTQRQRVKQAIHLPNLKIALKEFCPKHWFEFLIFVCAIGLPIHELMKLDDILKHWKKFSRLNQDNIVKILLRSRFETIVSDIEINELLHQYSEKEETFHQRVLYPKLAIDGYIEQYFFKSFYSYPSVEEIEHLWERIQSNAKEWKSI